MSVRSGLKTLRDYFPLWFCFLVPLILLPLPVAFPTPVGRCAYCVIVIALYWVTEAIPLAMTSLLPVVLFPMLGIMPVKDVCASYTTNTLMLFLGSLIVAVAVEKWNLHKRLALRTLTLVGPEPKWLLVGVMFPTWFLSMWMSNTAATAMMVPIVVAILDQIKECQTQEQVEDAILDGDDQETPGQDGNENDNTNETDNENRVNMQMSHTKPSIVEMELNGSPAFNSAMTEKRFLNLSKTFTLATAYSANIGGMATLTGTPPNIIFKQFADKIYQNTGTECPVNFANWLIVGGPISIILVLFCWVWLQTFSQGLRFLKCRKDQTNYEKIRNVLQREYDSLGPMRFPEIIVASCFVLMALLWVTRNPGFMPGWSSLFLAKYIGDSTPAVLIAVLLFILPARPPQWMHRFGWTCVTTMNNHMSTTKGYEPILDWNTVHQRLAWGVLLLMGGGFALADGCKVSGLSQYISGQLEGLSYMPNWTIALFLSMLIATATEVTSNAATTTLFVPIMGDLAIQMGIHPLFFMIPCTIATSLAFLLPVATPPNAIVFASGFLRVRDMVKAGLMMNFFSIIILNLSLHTWISQLYDLGTLPEELRSIQVNWTAT